MTNTDTQQSTPTGIGGRLIEITFRDGTTRRLQPTMGAMGYVETIGLSPAITPVAYMSALAHRLIQNEDGAAGTPSTWPAWADQANGPIKIDYIDDVMPDPTDGPLA